MFEYSTKLKALMAEEAADYDLKLASRLYDLSEKDEGEALEFFNSVDWQYISNGIENWTTHKIENVALEFERLEPESFINPRFYIHLSCSDGSSLTFINCFSIDGEFQRNSGRMVKSHSRDF